MTEQNILKRWSDAGFIAQVSPALEAVFSAKSTRGPVDLRGVVVGLDGALPRLLRADLQDLHAAELDASQSKFSCSFSRARIERSSFEKSRFDTCRFKETMFDATSFEGSKVDSPTLDDARFVGCLFAKSRLTGRGHREYGGRRAVFEKCDFRDVLFRNLSLRACTFRECVFEGTVFEKCILAGVKFEGTQPLPGCFIDCGES